MNVQDRVNDAEAFVELFGKRFSSISDPLLHVGIDWDVLGVPGTHLWLDGTPSCKLSGQISGDAINQPASTFLR